jgi:hypothetical protein
MLEILFVHAVALNTIVFPARGDNISQFVAQRRIPTIDSIVDVRILVSFRLTLGWRVSADDTWLAGEVPEIFLGK